MIVATSQSGIEQVQAMLRARCEELGLIVWRIDASGRIVQRPTPSGPAGPFLASGAFARAITNEVSRWGAQERPEPVECFPGCWLVPLPFVHRRRRSGYLVAVALSIEALESEEFAQICDRAQLDIRATRSLLSGGAIWSRSTVDRLSLMLEWAATDQQSIGAHEATVAGFSAQLSDSFEEISLLYSLGRSMNELEHPQKFVKLACEQLATTLSFRWIAVRFDPHPKRARGMADRLIISGELPCDADSFSAETSRVLKSRTDDSSCVLEGEKAGSLSEDGVPVLVHPVMRDSKVVGVLLAGGRLGKDTQVSSFDRKLLDATSGYLSIMLDNAFLYDDQQLMFLGTLEALSASIDAKDPYTRGHSERVSHLASTLTRASGLDSERAERLRVAGLIHDIGKLGVAESVLCKTGRLTRAEYEQMKRHPEIGYHILKDIPLIDDLLPAVLHHHERFDGNGYPHGLRGHDIPLYARIICVVDSFDAMSSNRTYRTAMTRKEVLAEMRANAGSQFDPTLIEAFASVDLTRYDELVARHYAGLETGIREISRGAAA